MYDADLKIAEAGRASERVDKPSCQPVSEQQNNAPDRPTDRPTQVDMN